MTMTTIKVKQSKTDKSPVSLQFDFGLDIHDAIHRFDGTNTLDKVVFELFVTAATQQLQDFVRSTIAKHKKAKKGSLSSAALQELVSAWKPEVMKRSKTNVNKAAAKIAGLSLAERKALMEQLGVPADIAEKALANADTIAAVAPVSTPRGPRKRSNVPAAVTNSEGSQVSASES